MKNPYSILGLSENSSEDELRASYEQLKAKYSEDRFLEGEAGNEGARKLMELEDAWTIIRADLSRKQAQSESECSGDFAEIDSLIKGGQYDAAQQKMDGVKVRTAEWHYYQSIIFYKREWLSESRTQLAMAVSMDPTNTKYAESLRRLDSTMGSPNTSQQSFNNGGAYNGGYNRQNDAANSLCRCCQIYCCMECLCSLCCH